MKVALGRFARSGIEERLGVDPGIVVQAALTHYMRRLSSHWRPVDVPRFMDVRPEAEDFLELTMAPTIEAELEREARRQHVSKEQVLRHAVLVYLADLDSTDTSEGSGPQAFEPPPLV